MQEVLQEVRVDFPQRPDSRFGRSFPHLRALRTIRLLVAGLLLASTAHADDEGPFSTSRTVIVTANKAPVMAGEETLHTASSGTVLRYSKENGPWLMIPRYGGWIKRDDVLPIEKAEEHFSAVIRTRPTAEAFHHRGVVRSETGQFAQAIADFDEAISQENKSSAMFVNRGIAKMRSGDRDAALKDFTAALEVDPDDLFALLNRSSLLLESRQLDAALVDIDSMLQAAPDFAEALNNRGVIRRLQSRFADAVADYSSAIEAFPRYAVAFANRGFAREKLGEFEAALADYAEARQLDPDLLSAYTDGAWVLATCRDEKFRDPVKAVELAEQARSKATTPSADLLDILAAAYAAAGRFDDAVATAEKAVELAPAEDKKPIIDRLETYRRKEAFVDK
jgi:tetratricopeptide (TPR) repeat protein